MSETPLKRAKITIPARFSGVPLLALPLTRGAVAASHRSPTNTASHQLLLRMQLNLIPLDLDIVIAKEIMAQ